MKDTKSNPITESIAYLEECGWNKEQATNLVGAIQAKSGDELWELAPKWIEHCGESMRYVHAMLGIVAMGMMKVTMGDDGEWQFTLSNKGIDAGNAMGLPHREHLED